MSRPGAAEIQLDLILDYRSNVALYPEFQVYFRNHQPPLLAVWGRHDPAFIPAGAEAYKRDLPDAKVQLLDTGHFALEMHADEIAQFVRGFPGQLLQEGFPAASKSIMGANLFQRPWVFGGKKTA